MRVPAEAVRPLRLAVLRRGGMPADTVWPGDEDGRSAHFAVSRAGAIVAVATVVVEAHPDGRGADGGDWRLRGMATDPAWRGQGLGASLVRSCVDHVRASGGRRVWCLARVGAVALYEREGFVVETGAFEVAGIGPHVRLARAV